MGKTKDIIFKTIYYIILVLFIISFIIASLLWFVGGFIVPYTFVLIIAPLYLISRLAYPEDVKIK